MNIKNKLLIALLLLVFVTSVGTVVAEDAGISDELATDDVDEAIALSEDVDEPLAAAGAEESLAAADNEETLAAGAEESLAAADNEETLAAGDESSSSGDEQTLASLGIRVEVLDKNVKVGDKFRVKVTIVNSGKVPAESVAAGLSFTDLSENPDATFKLVDNGGHAVQDAETGWVINLDYLAAGATEEVILTFLATESGTKNIVADVNADNSISEPDSETNTTITVGENSNSADNSAKVKVSAAKAMHATGNPLALLALSLFCIVPYYRRN